MAKLGRLLKPVIESQTEIAKVIEQQEQAKRSGEFDKLYADVKTDNKIEEENKAKETEEATEPPTDSGSESAEPESTEAPAEGDQATDTTSEENTDTETTEIDAVVAESLRNREVSIVTEDFGAIGELAYTAGSKLWSGLSYLGMLSINYGPKVAAALFKGVLIMLSRVAKLLVEGYEVSSKFIERRQNSLDRLEEQIVSVKESLSALQEKETLNDLSQIKYTDESAINVMKISDGIDLSKNITQLTDFMNSINKNVNFAMSNDLASVKHIMSMAKSKDAQIPSSVINTRHIADSMNQVELEGYETESEFVDSFVYSYGLPGDTLLIAHMPKSGLSEIEEITAAYNASKIFLGLDVVNFREVKEIPYMDLPELINFVDQLDNLVKVCKNHQTDYENINKMRKNISHSFKNYFNNLVQSITKVTLKKSLANYVYLKVSFTDKVYMSAAMDIHDYCSKVIVKSLGYVKKNVQAL